MEIDKRIIYKGRRVPLVLSELARVTKERDELARAFREIYDSLIDSGLPVIASIEVHALREKLEKRASE